jgi:hypothetical protein
MANIVACQTLGVMSTPSRAGEEQRSTQHATRLTHSLGWGCVNLWYKQFHIQKNE